MPCRHPQEVFSLLSLRLSSMAPRIVHDLSLSPLIGTLITMMLYGATLIQVYQYYLSCENDSGQMKLLVVIVFILETAHTAFVAHYVEYYLIEHFGDVQVLKQIPWTVGASVVVGFVVAWTVNQFFVRRIYVLSRKNLWLAIIISILATIRPAFGLTAAALTIIYPDWAVFKEHAQWIMITGLTLGLVVDCLVTYCVSYQLLKGRNTIFGPTRSIINTLLKYSINTGAILTIFALLELVGLAASTKSLAFLGLFQVQIQLYANCFLTNLNARQTIRGEAQVVTLSMESPRFPRLQPKTLHEGIQVQTETSITSDERRRRSEPSIEKMSPDTSPL